MTISRPRLRRGTLLILLGISATAATAASAAIDTSDQPFLKTWIHTADTPAHVIGNDLAQVQVLLHRETGLASAAMSRIRGQAGWSVAEHTHPESDELLYVLEGGGTLTLAGRKITLLRGVAVWIPKATPHAFVAGKDGIDALQIYAPGGPEQRFLKLPTAAR